jgi:hypothetical protein
VSPQAWQARRGDTGSGAGTERVAEKKGYPLRISADVLNATQHWADDELRSLNAQIEYVLRDALRKAGRLPKQPPDANDGDEE